MFSKKNKTVNGLKNLILKMYDYTLHRARLELG